MKEKTVLTTNSNGELVIIDLHNFDTEERIFSIYISESASEYLKGEKK